MFKKKSNAAVLLPSALFTGWSPSVEGKHHNPFGTIKLQTERVFPRGDAIVTPMKTASFEMYIL